MENSGLPQISPVAEDTELPHISHLTEIPQFEEIPEAVREVALTPRSSALPWHLVFWGFVASATLAVVSSLIGAAAREPVLTLQSFHDKAIGNLLTPESPAASPLPPALLGHLPYTEAPADQLAPVAPGSAILLRSAAATKFQEMTAAAAADGVRLAPLSGFRTIADQTHLFFDLKEQRGQTSAERASLSAPPGYSEHHTGYAVDIGDGDAPDLNLKFEFDQSRAFQWLRQNANRYSFELSFPKDNALGISYEPWHWRFVGDRDSLETFYRAKQQSAGK